MHAINRGRDDNAHKKVSQSQQVRFSVKISPKSIWQPCSAWTCWGSLQHSPASYLDSGAKNSREGVGDRSGGERRKRHGGNERRGEKGKEKEGRE